MLRFMLLKIKSATKIRFMISFMHFSYDCKRLYYFFYPPPSLDKSRNLDDIYSTFLTNLPHFFMCLRVTNLFRWQTIGSHKTENSVSFASVG